MPFFNSTAPCRAHRPLPALFLPCPCTHTPNIRLSHRCPSKIVPFLKAPGFCTVRADTELPASIADYSAGGLVFNVRTVASDTNLTVSANLRWRLPDPTCFPASPGWLGR